MYSQEQQAAIGQFMDVNYVPMVTGQLQELQTQQQNSFNPIHQQAALGGQLMALNSGPMVAGQSQEPLAQHRNSFNPLHQPAAPPAQHRNSFNPLHQRAALGQFMDLNSGPMLAGNSQSLQEWPVNHDYESSSLAIADNIPQIYSHNQPSRDTENQYVNTSTPHPLQNHQCIMGFQHREIQHPQRLSIDTSQWVNHSIGLGSEGVYSHNQYGNTVIPHLLQNQYLGINRSEIQHPQNFHVNTSQRVNHSLCLGSEVMGTPFFSDLHELNQYPEAEFSFGNTGLEGHFHSQTEQVGLTQWQYHLGLREEQPNVTSALGWQDSQKAECNFSWSPDEASSLLSFKLSDETRTGAACTGEELEMASFSEINAWRHGPSVNKSLDSTGSVLEMSEITTIKFKNVISEMKRKMDEEGDQMAPFLYDIWRRDDNSIYKRSFAGLRILNFNNISQRLDGEGYNTVDDFVNEVQAMLMGVADEFRRTQVVDEVKTIYGVFIESMDRTFEGRDFSKVKNEVDFTGGESVVLNFSSHPRVAGGKGPRFITKRGSKVIGTLPVFKKEDGSNNKGNGQL